MYKIDLNSDVGEGVGNEAQLLPLLSSCNIACGGHAGDTMTIQSTIELAIQHQVKIGAHPGYPDKENFGRQILDITPSDLRKSLTDQIVTVKDFAERQHQKLHHVKVHGALYNLASVDVSIARLIIDVVKEIDDQLVIYVPYQSVIQKEVKDVLQTKIEGFADRRYNSDYTLVSRSLPDAVIHDASDVLAHIIPMITAQELTTITDMVLPFHIDTLCVHGDTPTAFQILKMIHQGLKDHQIQVC
ncbi:5-oxoprolinase subunit PxpA [uncultured Dokdonia sp.]|uniref:5-oxoprolinase subunit PxpA n=1 Tax=uncultured Dokdonia sp. TaxID=575653 RepID=UPI002612A808|nr:5-oxoprolinase subunit PxpA [uncultured Dokdonia sp.]